MPDFYYQIKGRGQPLFDGDSPWAWPPEFSGLVSASSKQQARLQVEEEFDRKFPVRVLRKDLDQHPYLLHLREVGPTDDYILRRFQKTECKECGGLFRLIDKYNDPNADYKGQDYCSAKCNAAGRLRDTQDFRLVYEGKVPPVIYRVRQISTGKAYVGQTTQAFTLRWWQHVTVPTGCKFHEALKASELTDWEFCVLEVISVPAEVPDRAAYINERERHWIVDQDAITAGFNSVLPGGQDC